MSIQAMNEHDIDIRANAGTVDLRQPIFIDGSVRRDGHVAGEEAHVKRGRISGRRALSLIVC